uniref:Uncharacterized protein n=1 Tax=Tetranychus urticae TaxID=32264 RepID=T1K237_TETUR
MNAGNIVEFTFRPSPEMMAPKPYWYSKVLCHIKTPFPLLAEHIIKREIKANDPGVTPYSLDIGNGVDVFGQTTGADHRNLAQMSDNELSDWIIILPGLFLDMRNQQILLIICRLVSADTD